MLNKKRISVQEMLSAEEWIDSNWTRLMSDCKTIDDLSKKLKLSVGYYPPDELPDNVEAMLAPPKDPVYNGDIKISNIFRGTNFSYIHEIMHYLLDVKEGNKVKCVFARKTKGSDKSHREQVIDYHTAAATMRYRDVKRDIIRYDKSNPKMDELKFVDELCTKYAQERKAVLRRIREVRRIHMDRQSN